jgi:hypothetical protein
MQEQLFDGAFPRVFVTTHADADRAFVWSKTGWYERLADGDTGAVAFSPVADSESELRSWLLEDDPDEDIDERDDGFADMVRDEFLNQTPLYPEAAELSDPGGGDA